jgi:prepilin-type N-terminal cleavage/methylation domain-containing protein
MVILRHKGFTLMEVMVAVTIFTIIVTVGIGALLTINASNKQARVERQAVDAITFTLESMSRRIRTAQSWDASIVNGTTQNSFAFVDQDGIFIRYSWYPVDKKIIMDIQNNGSALETVPDGTYDLTPEGIQITDQDSNGPIDGGLAFTVTGFDPSGAAVSVPYVQINVGGLVATGNQSSHFSFQTGVSKRSRGI